jgi:hypothetical protein
LTTTRRWAPKSRLRLNVVRPRPNVEWPYRTPPFPAEPAFLIARSTSLRLRWPQVDLKSGRITTTCKGGQAIFLPISSAMREILLSRIGHHPETVFTYVRKHPSGSPMRVLGARYYCLDKSKWTSFTAFIQRISATLELPLTMEEVEEGDGQCH